MRGLLPPYALQGHLGRAQANVATGQWAWAAVSAWGYVDAPVSWIGQVYAQPRMPRVCRCALTLEFRSRTGRWPQRQDHGFVLHGENVYSHVVLPGAASLVTYRASGPVTAL